MSSEALTMLMKHGEDMEWFLSNYDKLVKRYDGLFVAVYERGVIDSDEDLDRLIERVSRKWPLERVIIEYVSKEKPLLVL